jgi:hypothetical protein
LLFFKKTLRSLANGRPSTDYLIILLAWGKRSEYWTGDTADLEIGQDFADAEDEERAAKVDFINTYFVKICQEVAVHCYSAFSSLERKAYFVRFFSMNNIAIVQSSSASFPIHK